MKKILVLLLLQFFALTFAQPGSLDPTFDSGTGVGNIDETVVTASLQTDGKIIIGGSFLHYNGFDRKLIARLNSDGSMDMSFTSGFLSNVGNFDIRSTAIQPDGKIIIGGSFSSYSGMKRNNIARLNADGSLDTTFDPGKGIDGLVDAVALQPDGKVIVAGNFYSCNGTISPTVVRLNADGSVDKSFNPGTETIPATEAVVIVVQADGKIILGGDLTGFNGTEVNNLVRLNADGSLDTGFKICTDTEVVWDICLQPDGKIIIGGIFTSYSGVNRNSVARLNADGSLDMTFNPGTSSGDMVLTISLQKDGKILIGGDMKGKSGKSGKNIFRLNTDGSLDTCFNPTVVTNGWVRTTLIQPDNKIIVGGEFTTYDGVVKNNIARLDYDLLPPTAVAQTFCTGSTVANLTASGTDLKWYATASGNVPLASTAVLSSGTYYVSQTIWCESAKTAVPIVVKAPLKPVFTQVNVLCSGDSASALSPVSDNGISGTWSPALDNTKTMDYTFTPTSGECATMANMTITVKPIVTTVFTQISPICAGASLELPATSDNGIAGTWTPAVNNMASTNYTFTPAAESCGTIVNMTVAVNALPDIDADYTKVICSGDSEVVQLNAGLLSGSQSDYSYQWFKDGQLEPLSQSYYLSGNSEGVYTCKVKNIKTGCERTRTITVVYSTKINIEKVVIVDFSDNNKVTIIDSGSGNSEYSLDNPEGPFQESNVFENVAPGIHEVYVNDKNGCGVVSKTIAVVGAPPFFTPNGDGFNDKWKLKGVNAVFYKNSRVDIFDRFGKLLKVLSDGENDGWDGTYNGHQEPSNDYWFVANLEDGRTVKGHFALKR